MTLGNSNKNRVEFVRMRGPSVSPLIVMREKNGRCT